jgi:hypothetical protein
LIVSLHFFGDLEKFNNDKKRGKDTQKREEHKDIILCSTRNKE